MAQAFARVSLDTAAAQSYAQALLKAPQIVQEELSAALTEAMLLIERETKDRAPVGVTQALRGSIASELRGSTPTELEGVVFSPMPYAAAPRAR